MRIRCFLRGFFGTLAGLGAYEVDGHIYDEKRYYEIRGFRQYEYAYCVDCRRKVEQGWHRLG